MALFLIYVICYCDSLIDFYPFIDFFMDVHINYPSGLKQFVNFNCYPTPTLWALLSSLLNFQLTSYKFVASSLFGPNQILSHRLCFIPIAESMRWERTLALLVFIILNSHLCLSSSYSRYISSYRYWSSE